MPSLFRFRSTKAILDEHHELDRQTIYFATPDQLNDPMEGLPLVKWHGDSVLWRNLLRNYLLNIFWFTDWVQIHDDKSWEQDRPRRIICASELPTDVYREMFAAAWADFSGFPAVNEAIAQLTMFGRPLSRSVVTWYLYTLHTLALRSAWGVLEARGRHVLRDGIRVDDLPADATRAAEQLARFRPILDTPAGRNSTSIDVLFNVALTQVEQIGLHVRYHNTDGSDRMFFLPYEFPLVYLDLAYKSFAHSAWSTACFSRNCTNASMWGTYGDQHRGVALQFRAHDDEQGQYINLEGVTGWSGTRSEPEGHPVKSWRRYQFEPVAYTGIPAEIDFFQDLGNLTPHVVYDEWHTDGRGTRSPRIEAMGFDKEEWRLGYWRRLIQSRTSKLEDWKHEEEVRLVLTEVVVPHEDVESRTFHYDINDLDGIVFGIRTPVVDKLRIIRTLLAKPDLRPDFKFQQAQYSPEAGKMEIVPLTLIKPPSPTTPTS